MVYKEEYYATREEWPEFTLTEDYIYNLMSFQDIARFADICIGEYLIEAEDGYVFRRYYVDGQNVEYGPASSATMGVDEWHISQDGAAEYILQPEVYRELDLPISMY